MTPTARLRARLPRWLFRHLLAFEASIDDAVAKFAAALPEASLVLDAGSGEGQYRHWFSAHRYVGVDLAIGDESWDYTKLDIIADLNRLPFARGAFGGALNVVTLEHLKDPQLAINELLRILEPGGRLLLVAPQDWEVHQAPHDYFRYTRYGLRLLLERAGFVDVHVYPCGGFFRLLSRRLLNGLKYFHGIWWLFAAAFVAVPALLLPFLDGLDRDRDFTLGYTCTARKPSS